MDTVTSLARFQKLGSAQIHPVILSGGAGTRLWPLSRAAYPKQLLKLVSDRSLLQETVARPARRYRRRRHAPAVPGFTRCRLP
jgi:mannose-1-phosphate guanylyltransferase/mannose-6-phosphate isomerase